MRLTTRFRISSRTTLAVGKSFLLSRVPGFKIQKIGSNLCRSMLANILHSNRSSRDLLLRLNSVLWQMPGTTQSVRYNLLWDRTEIPRLSCPASREVSRWLLANSMEGCEHCRETLRKATARMESFETRVWCDQPSFQRPTLCPGKREKWQLWFQGAQPRCVPVRYYLGWRAIRRWALALRDETPWIPRVMRREMWRQGTHHRSPAGFHRYP